MAGQCQDVAEVRCSAATEGTSSSGSDARVARWQEQPLDPATFFFDDFELLCPEAELRRNGILLRVDATAMRLLEILVRNAGRLVPKAELHARVWHTGVVSDRALVPAMSRLRKMFHEQGMPSDTLVTVYGRGYRFTRSVARGHETLQSFDSGQPSLPCVGREQLILQLKAALADARSRRGGLIVLRGDPGVGKSHLAEMLSMYASQWRFTTSSSAYRRDSGGDGATLGPFIALLRSVLRQLEGHTTFCRQSWWPQLSPLLPELIQPSVCVGVASSEAVDLRDFASKRQLFAAILQALAFAFEISPCLLILDDLQHADESSIELLGHLLPMLAHSRVVVVATLGLVSAQATAHASLLGVLCHRNCTRITLNPLTQREVGRYVAALVDGNTHELSYKIYQLSDGNPRCMAALLQQVLKGHAIETAAAFVLRSDLESVTGRLASLPADARDVLSYASVIGKNFSLPLLAAVTERSAAALMSTLEIACRAGLVQTAAGSCVEFCFAHLLRSAIYERQSAAERRGRHLRVARVLEARLALGEVSYSELADHAWAALPNYDLRKTVMYCIKAASTAEHMCAHAEVVRYRQYARQAAAWLECLRVPAQ